MSSPFPLLLAHGLDGIFAASRKVGLFDALETPKTFDALAAELHLDRRALTLVLDALLTTGVVEERETGFCFAGNPLSRAAWPFLERFLRNGTLLTMDDYKRGRVEPGTGDPDARGIIDDRSARGPGYAKAVAALGQQFIPHAQDLAAQLRVVGSVLDVGAGSAVWSLAMGERSPETRVTILDLPEVIEVGKLWASTLGMIGRVDAIAGDYFEVDIDKRFDRIVLANVLHLETAEDAERLIARYAAMLDEGGELVIIDAFGGHGLHELFRNVYAVHLGLRTKRGQPHRLEDMQRWCVAAGFGDVDLVRPHSMAGVGALVCRATSAGASQSVVETMAERERADISKNELRQLRWELDKSNLRSNTFMFGATDAFAVVRYGMRRIVNVNDALNRLFARSWEPYTLHDYAELVAPEELARFEAMIDAMEQGELEERRHVFTMMRGEERFEAEVTCHAPSYPTSAILMFRDRTEMVRQEKLRALSALLAGMAHDVNTPLGVLRSNVDLVRDIGGRLSDEALSDAKREHLQGALDDASTNVTSALERLERLMAELSGLAQLDSVDGLGAHATDGLTKAIYDQIATGAEQPGERP